MVSCFSHSLSETFATHYSNPILCNFPPFMCVFAVYKSCLPSDSVSDYPIDCVRGKSCFYNRLALLVQPSGIWCKVTYHYSIAVSSIVVKKQCLHDGYVCYFLRQIMAV
jgi:hypothetical protein